ncbi:ATP-binding protein [Phenylobacterium sp. J367]|uniref:ATP-binding protein n=1 Tax=Phenylobacterium sp. J367 TaxID=2898435 RepID=UPI002150D0AD|nr:ATP-binding protein [Phenylobacterium sp. J367]MCR5879705.1 response regulator [Phenylobacterium sp. J367]
MSDLQVQHAERELELTSAREAAERASRAKSRLLATVGHELRTPLQGALGLIELADAPGAPLDADSLRRALLHLAGVVGDLTDLGALEGGLLPVGRERYDAEAAAASVAALHQPAARAAGREIVFEGVGAPLWVWGDEGRVRQVLGNLVANALRHGHGEVRLKLEASPGERLVCAVSDEGPQLSDAELMRIFEPFDRAGREADDGGLGVGLFLGRNLARAMGGDLVVRALPDGGKAFVLEIAAPAAEAGETAARAAGLAGVRVLLAEDTDLSRAVLAALLRREGCEVVEVEDGAAALACLDGGGFDLALLDQRMPRLLGLQVAQRLPKGDARPMCVLMTASSDPALERTARAAGVDIILQKPVTLAHLRALSPGRIRPSISRAAELRVQLGAGAAELFAEVRPSVEREVAELAAALASNDTPRFDAQRHRLRGLADHFGLQTIVEAVDETGPPAFMIERLGAAVQRTDWSAYEAG